MWYCFNVRVISGGLKIFTVSINTISLTWICVVLQSTIVTFVFSCNHGFNFLFLHTIKQCW